MNRSKSIIGVLASAAILFGTLSAQTTSVLTTGLTKPNKVIAGPDNSLIVSEAGTTAANSGRISIVDRTSGARHTLIGGLPSAVSNLGGAPDPDGPSGLFLQGNRLYVTIGVGDAVVPGPGPGRERPNPAPPSSPIFNSVLELTLPGGFPALASGFTMTLADQTALAAGDEVILTNAQGRSIVIKLIANLADYIPAPIPGPTPDPDNVKASHLYGIEMFQRDLYVVDSGLNRITRIDRETGAAATLTSFPNRPNPSFPGTGGPFIEAVPDNIHRFGNRFLVPLLTGFPFVQGLAEIRAVDIKTGEHVGLIPNLTSAIDIAKAESPDTTPSLVTESKGKSVDVEASKFAPGDENAFYTLEFSTNLLGGAPGRLRYYSAPDASPVNLITNLITPTSMVRDGETGNIYITNIGPGTITKVVLP